MSEKNLLFSFSNVTLEDIQKEVENFDTPKASQAS